MSDGTMAIPVSPTEDVMRLSAMFSKAAEAIVNASTMPKVISDLTTRVEQLQNQLDHATTHSQALDSALNDMRSSRDGVVADFDRLQDKYKWIDAELTRTQIERDETSHRNNTQAETIHRLKDEIETLKRERDDNGFHSLELQEKLDNVEKRMSELFGLVKPIEAKPQEPTPVEAPKSEPVPESAPLVNDGPFNEPEHVRNHPYTGSW